MESEFVNVECFLESVKRHEVEMHNSLNKLILDFKIATLKYVVNIGYELKVIPGYDNYVISTKGDVYNLDNMKRMNGLRVSLRKDKKEIKEYLNRLVALTYLENPDNLRMVKNIDGDKTNNHLSNLCWTSQSKENMNRKKRDNASSKYKGVYRDKDLWVAQIYQNGKRVWWDKFDSEIKAALAYNEEMLKLYGDRVTVNLI